MQSYRHKNLITYLNLASSALLRPYEDKRDEADFWNSDNSSRQDMEASLQNVITGLKEYQTYPWHRPETRCAIWRDGEATLFEFEPQNKKTGQIILLIPSLINGSEIFDILPQRSFAGWLAAQGHHVYLIDWGDLPNDPELRSLELILTNKIGRILQKINQPLTGLGYCMGGLLLAAAEKLYSDAFKALCFIATPWDFSGDFSGDFQSEAVHFPDAVRAWWQVNSGDFEKLQALPAENLQTVFASLDPHLIVRKFSSFANTEKKSFEAKLFVAVEDWVNGGSDLPMPVVREMAQSWYLNNAPLKGEWTLDGKIIAAPQTKKPTYIILPQRDKIVPPTSAQALAQQIPHATVLEADCGHIAMMIGRNAERDIWTPFHKWLQGLS